MGDVTKVLREEIELIETVYPEFKPEDYQNSEISPVFGSALNNFGVKELLDCFWILHRRHCRPKKTREVNPYEEKFTGLY